MEETTRGKVLESFPLYSTQCVDYLKQAVTRAEANGVDDDFRRYYAPADEIGGWSSSDEGQKDTSSVEDSSSADEKEGGSNGAPNLVGTPPLQLRTDNSKHNLLNEKQKDAAIRQFGRPPCTYLPLSETENVIELPVALLSKQERLSNGVVVGKSYLKTAMSLCMDKKHTVVILLRSGRFAGAIFLGPKCVQHTTSARYTIRKGQGKAQSAQDGKRKPKSVGSQLRRAGEEALRQDVTSFLERNKALVKSSELILISCPRVMMKPFFDDNHHLISRGDDRLKKVPLDVGRPTFEASVAVYEIMMQVNICEKSIESEKELIPTTLSLPVVVEKPNEEKPVEKPNEIIPLTPLHDLANAASLAEMLHFLDITPDFNVNCQAGEDFMTPLHYAAQAASAECVTALLIQGKANPCIQDARCRPPYFLASQEKVREAFRMARATLGEDYCRWDEAAKVGPPMTMDDVHKKKEKAAEKKRRQKSKQKDKKAKERVIAEESEKQRKAEDDAKKEEEEAKRIRDGLQPKMNSATNVCDFCQKQCRNKRRSQMLQRLEYAYCSTECVQNHKRELMAAAAIARFGS